MENLKKLLKAIKDRIVVFHSRKQTMKRSYLIVIAALCIYALIHFYWTSGPAHVEAPETSFTEFMSMVERGEVAEVRIGQEQIAGKLKNGALIKTRIESKLVNPLQELRTYKVVVFFDEDPYSPQAVGKNSYVTFGIVAIVIICAYFFIWGIGPRGEIRFRILKSRAKKPDPAKKVTFLDVAGIDEVKGELQVIIDYLKDPERFRRLGARAPRGTLLVGPPGVGKTLIARAVAGEAGVPFFSMAGSDFQEMFVGVGASRVRGLFDQAKANAPAIIYIDEIDSVGSKRGIAYSGGDRESQQTTVALLNEIDGFEQNPDVIFLASTNNPESLDDALLRSGRFDNQIVVPFPDAKGRREILKVHVRTMPLGEDVNLDEIALGTPGMSGADMENIANNAALKAANESSTKVTRRHFDRAKDHVLMGPERKSFVLTDEDRWLIALHEAGHAIVAIKTPGTDPIEKILCMPRGKALGVTIQLPVTDRVHTKKSFLTTKLLMIMGGRAAEHVFFDTDVSAGAQQDIEQATRLATAMVCQLGMSDAIGPLALKESHTAFLNRGDSGRYACSSGLAYEADMEIKRLVNTALDGALSIVRSEKSAIERVSKELVARTELSGQEIQLLLDGKELPPKIIDSSE
ncbi:MAG: ATP-dependent zinc metalloprotease FtsH [bacterium]|nr:ATP-dependent zinc metalloprotease FtsH [bacterium]